MKKIVLNSEETATITTDATPTINQEAVSEKIPKTKDALKQKGPTLSELGSQLAKLQRKIIEQKIPVVILVDGWENSGKGEVINALSYELDPRYYSVALFDDDYSLDQKRNYLFRFWNHLPRKGHITFYDRSIYFKVLDDYKMSTSAITPILEDIYGFMRMLIDDGTIVIKLFLNISQEEQVKRLKKLEKMPLKKIFLNERDYSQKEHYKEYKTHFRKIIRQTDHLYSRWQVVPMDKEKQGCKLALQAVIDELNKGIEAVMAKASKPSHISPNSPTVLPTYQSALPDDLTVSVTEEAYRQELLRLQQKARLLSFMLCICQIPTICMFEGTDAAGKGGTIKRLTKEIDPRGYDIYQTAAPTEDEASYHYMRRFMIHIPPPGKMAIFDRTWYGRVLVERVEGFATMSEWTRAYHEINVVERHLVQSGVNVFKFFLAINKDEQMRRFQEREKNPEKQYKITAEDWRNREKWDIYMEAFQEMFYRTSTSTAPWTIIPANNKYYARLTVLRTYVNQSEHMLHEFQSLNKNFIDWNAFWSEYTDLDKLYE